MKNRTEQNIQKPKTNSSKQKDNPLQDDFLSGLSLSCFGRSFHSRMARPLTAMPTGPAASQGVWLPTRTGQAGAPWEPESCHSWGAGKKTWGVRQPQTGWDKQAT